jgi:hypothetical protein
MDQYKSSFFKCKLGNFSEQSLRIAFDNGNAIFQVGMMERIKLLFSRAIKDLSIVRFENESVLKVDFLKGRFGTFPGCNWRVPFGCKAKKTILTYKFRFSDDFDFARGGKLPGLAGGKGNDGGRVPNGLDGWSVRFMYKDNGTICAYLYHPKMKEAFGEKVFLGSNGENFMLAKGEWNELVLEISMNDIGQNNGSIVCKLNGNVGLKLNAITFTCTENLLIDHFLFSCFMGGNDISYAPSKNQHIMFKDFLIQY